MKTKINTLLLLTSLFLFTGFSNTYDAAGSQALQPLPGDTLRNKLKPVLQKRPSQGLNVIVNAGVGGGKGSAAGISDKTKLMPVEGLQVSWNNVGIGFETGTYNSMPDFDFQSYYDQFKNLGFAKFDQTQKTWKSTYMALGPQYTFHLLPAKQLTGQTGSRSSDLALTISAKAGFANNTPPKILISDTIAPYTSIASYTAPDDYKTKRFTLLPKADVTYWFSNMVGVNLNIGYLFMKEGAEFATGYRDLSKINWAGVSPKEARLMILRMPVVKTTTTGPASMLTVGAGISLKFDGGKPRTASPRQDAAPGAIVQQPVNPSTGQASPAPLQQNKPDEQQKDREYSRPVAMSPSDGATLTKDELKRSIVLKWAPVSPPPPQPVIYHVSVYEAQPGQSPAQTIKSAKPVFAKDITGATQTGFSPATEPRKDSPGFVWTVQATDASGKPFGSNNGTSDPSTFKIGENDIDIAIDTLKVECCKDGKQQIKLTIKNNLANTNTILKKIIITAVNGNFGIPYPMDISASVSPPLPYSFLPSSASLTMGRMNFTASVDCKFSIDNLVVRAEGERSTNMGLVTDNDLESDTLNCICRECDKIKIEIPEKALTVYNTNAITLNTPVSVSPKKVKKITADVVYFSFVPESDECAPCNKDNKTYGNIASATLSAAGFPSNAVVPYGHEAQWNSNNPGGSLLNGQFAFNISVPPVVKCCPAKFRFCIRYTFQFDDCTVCEKVVCYTVNKEGCNK